MNALPSDYRTVANWPLQGSLADTSGNGLDLITLKNSTALPGGTEQYGLFDASFYGFKFDTQTELIAPDSNLLRLGGEWTIQFMLLDTSTLGGNQPFFCLVNPNGRVGGSASDRIGSVFNFFWSSQIPGTHPYWSDQTHGSNIPRAGGNWWDTTDVQWGLAPGVVHAITVRFKTTGVSLPTVDLFIDQTQQPSSFNTTNNPVIVGNERFYIGGIENGIAESPALNSLIGGMRVSNTALSTAEIVSDATYMAAPAGTPYPGSRVNFDPDDRRDSPILRGKAGFSMQTGFKERVSESTGTIAAFRNMTAAAQAGNVFRQRPRMFPMPDDGRST